MSKKVKVLASALVAVALLAVAGTTIVMAQEETAPEETLQAEANGLLTRVAEILGIGEEDLVNAFNQARQEMRDEACLRWLDKAVEKGLIDEAEAEEIKGWWGEKPEAFDRLCPRARISAAIRSRQMWQPEISFKYGYHTRSHWLDR